MRWRSSLVLIREIHQGTIRSCLSFTRALHQQDPETLGHRILQTSAHSISSQIRCRDELLKPIENPDPALNKQFQEIIGQLLYCQQQTVPEISWSVSILARFTTKAGALTWRSPRKSFAIYKAEKASLSDGALALVNSRICRATSMATQTPALPISSPPRERPCQEREEQ